MGSFFASVSSANTSSYEQFGSHKRKYDESHREEAARKIRRR